MELTGSEVELRVLFGKLPCRLLGEGLVGGVGVDTGVSLFEHVFGGRLAPICEGVILLPQAISCVVRSAHLYHI